MGFFADRFLIALGDQRAIGREYLRSASKLIRNEWEQYAGRNNIRNPTLGEFYNFLAVSMDVHVDEDDDIDSDAVINVDEVIPKIANILIDKRKIGEAQ